MLRRNGLQGVRRMPCVLDPPFPPSRACMRARASRCVVCVVCVSVSRGLLVGAWGWWFACLVTPAAVARASWPGGRLCSPLRGGQAALAGGWPGPGIRRKPERRPLGHLARTLDKSSLDLIIRLTSAKSCSRCSDYNDALMHLQGPDLRNRRHC